MVSLALAFLMQSPSEELRQKLDALEPKHFSGMVYVLHDGKEKFFHAVGYDDPEKRRPFTRTSAIEVGSIVKPFVRVAFLRLAEKGKVVLSDSIAKYFAGVPADKREITLDLLLSHKSGFKDVLGGDYEPMQRDELMSKMLSSTLLFKPGTKEEYSNAGFSMLATILEKVTGEPIDDYLWRTQFKPLGMHRTGYRRSGWKREDLPLGFDADGKRWGTPMDRFWYADGPSWNLRGNGGMMSTVTDLGRWIHAIFESSFVSDSIRLQLSPGVFGKDAPPTRLWAAAGGNGIYNAIAAYNRGHKTSVVAFSTDGRLAIEDELRPLYQLMIRVAETPR